MTDVNEIDVDRVRLQRLYPEWTVRLFERGTHPGPRSAPRVQTFGAHRNGTSADYRTGAGLSVAAAAIDFLWDMEQKRRTF